MKLLIIGSDKVFSIENFYVKYLKEFGINVNCFTAQATFYDYYYEGNILRKLLFKIGLSPIIKKINIDFKKIVTNFQPDIIWVFKGMEITPASLQWAKKQGIPLVNYNPDNPFIFSILILNALNKFSETCKFLDCSVNKDCCPNCKPPT